MFRAGDRLGAFELIEDPIGDHVLALVDGQRVELLLHEAPDDPFVRLRLSEIELGYELAHRNLARLVAVTYADGHVVHAQEHLPGVTLRDRTPVPIGIAVAVAIEVCAGLHYLHEFRGLAMIHRVLTPRAIKIGRDGNVKVHDVVLQGWKRAEHFRFLSPEQCRGRPLDRRSDIYALADILWEATVGQPRLSGDLMGKLETISKRDAVPPRAVVADYPPALERILMRALARDPEHRHASMLELSLELEALPEVASRAEIAAFAR